MTTYRRRPTDLPTDYDTIIGGREREGGGEGRGGGKGEENGGDREVTRWERGEEGRSKETATKSYIKKYTLDNIQHTAPLLPAPQSPRQAPHRAPAQRAVRVLNNY